jgi:hypothetical protein
LCQEHSKLQCRPFALGEASAVQPLRFANIPTGHVSIFNISLKTVKEYSFAFSIDPINDHECAAVSHDYFGRLKTRFVGTSKTDLCPQTYLCYKATNDTTNQIQCNDKGEKNLVASLSLS